MAKIRIEYYGCSANVADAEIMAGILKERGHEIVDDDEDLNILVTCTVKDATANRMIDRIKRLSNKPLIVGGCFAKAEYERVRELNPSASVISPDAIDRIDEVVDNLLNNRRMVILDGNANKLNLPKLRFNPIISIIEIGSGCLSECTFCETKLAKGWLKSYEPKDIVRNISKEVREGCKEIWLTSTDNGAYGRDLGTNLARLLNEINSIEGEFKVRVGMMHPIFIPSMLEDLIEAYRSEKVFKFIHIPIQSGSDKILRLMKRNHKVDIFYYIVKRFREEIKDVTLATDIIVGFPGEKEEDFNATIDLIKDTRPDIVNISKYSARPNTPALLFNEKLDDKTIKQRSTLLHNIVKDLTQEKNKAWIGWEGEVLIDECKDDGVQGRNYAYKPIFIKEHHKLGTYLRVKITKALPNSLIAEVI